MCADGDWIMKCVYVQWGTPALKRKDTGVATEWVNPEGVMLSEIRQTQRTSTVWLL